MEGVFKGRNLAIDVRHGFNVGAVGIMEPLPLGKDGAALDTSWRPRLRRLCAFLHHDGGNSG